MLDDYQSAAERAADWASLDDTEVTFFSDRIVEPDDLVRRLIDFDIVVTMRERTAFPHHVISRLPRLRLIVVTGRRSRVIDLAAAERAGITVCNTRGHSRGVVELTWALILALVRHVPAEDARIRSGGWQHTVGDLLEGKTLGVVGLGKVGGQVAAIGSAFGMRVVAWSPNLAAERADSLNVQAVDKGTLFETADLVTVHMVMAESTVGLIGEAEMRAMRRTSFIVNTSRGPLVDERALARALREGWIAGAALDVYDVEPLPEDHPLRDAPNTVLTPHIGFVTKENYRLLYGDAVENIRGFAVGNPQRVMKTDGW